VQWKFPLTNPFSLSPQARKTRQLLSLYRRETLLRRLPVLPLELILKSEIKAAGPAKTVYPLAALPPPWPATLKTLPPYLVHHWHRLTRPLCRLFWSKITPPWTRLRRRLMLFCLVKASRLARRLLRGRPTI